MTPGPVADDRARVIAAHFPCVVVEPNGAVRARCESSRCEWYVLRDTPRTYRNWRVVIRLHSAHLAAVLASQPVPDQRQDAAVSARGDLDSPTGGKDPS